MVFGGHIAGVVCALAMAVGLAHAQDLRNVQNPDEIQKLVEAGALPRSALAQRDALRADADDAAILKRTLFGNLTVQDLTEEQATEMVAAAQRRLTRWDARLAKAQELVKEGVAAQSSLDGLREERDSRELTLRLALSRASVLREVIEMARAERDAEAAAEAGLADDRRTAVRFDGNGLFGKIELKKVELAFEHEFHQSLPISANGETATHKALGYDHRGRVDVALNPDQPEGVWLRHFLEKQQIPYFAFRAAMAGSATGPHIHLGPPSLRLRAAD
jgi:hypothetical protein